MFSKQVEAHLISPNGTEDEYFSVTVNTSAKKFELVPNSNSTNPSGNVTCKLVITTYDAFGHKNVIGNNPALTVTVKKR